MLPEGASITDADVNTGVSTCHGTALADERITHRPKEDKDIEGGPGVELFFCEIATTMPSVGTLLNDDEDGPNMVMTDGSGS